MLPFKLIYSDKYDLHLGDHVFPSSKYRLIHEKLLESQLASATDFLEPQPAEDTEGVSCGAWTQDAAQNVTAEYLSDLSVQQMRRMEVAHVLTHVLVDHIGVWRSVEQRIDGRGCVEDDQPASRMARTDVALSSGRSTGPSRLIRPINSSSVGCRAIRWISRRM